MDAHLATISAFMNFSNAYPLPQRCLFSSMVNFEALSVCKIAISKSQHDILITFRLEAEGVFQFKENALYKGATPCGFIVHEG